MTMLFLGGHGALDFLNSAYTPHGEWIDTIPDGAAFLRWLVEAELIDEAKASELADRFGAEALDHTAAEARALREEMREWVGAWRAGTPIAVAPRLNALLTSGTFAWRVEEDGSVVATPQFDQPDALLALIARQIALLFGQEDAALARACEGPKCTLHFIDRSKAHRRRFCSAAVCGNRVKAAAFRNRKSGR